MYKAIYALMFLQKPCWTAGQSSKAGQSVAGENRAALEFGVPILLSKIILEERPLLYSTMVRY